MKKTKNLIITVSLLLGLAMMLISFTDSNKEKLSNPPSYWGKITVKWSGNCVYNDQNAKYLINLQIWDESVSPPVKLYDKDKEEETTETQTVFFIYDTLCNIDQYQKIYRSIATVKKVYKSSLSIICSGQNDVLTNCEDLIDLEISVPLN